MDIFSELSTMTHPSWVALHGMAHIFIELDKAVACVISLISFFVIVIFILPALRQEDKRFRVKIREVPVRTD